jgi:NAD(P)-dependent dehydrogenase (short-subunit alcohol dehydrogenase family)
MVTGGYAGIGLETTRALAKAGAAVIVPARTPDKARHALSSLHEVQRVSEQASLGARSERTAVVLTQFT